MKKTIILIVTVLIVCTLLFNGCNGFGYAIPKSDDFDLTGRDSNGISGTTVLSFSTLSQNNDKPLNYEDIKYVVANEEDKWSDKYYTITLSLGENEQGKMVERRHTLTYTNAITNDDLKPSNKDDFVYVSNAIPKEIYEFDYLYTLKKVSMMPNANNGARPYDFVVNGRDWINHKLFNFLRYTYLQTGGKVNLEITYDTSFNYQTDDFGGGMVIRAKITVTECSLSQNATLSDLFNAKVGDNSLLGIFNSTGHKLGIKLTSNVELAKDATTWCDIQIGVPNVSPADNGLWAYMLYYYNQI